MYPTAGIFFNPYISFMTSWPTSELHLRDLAKENDENEQMKQTAASGCTSSLVDSQIVSSPAASVFQISSHESFLRRRKPAWSDEESITAKSFLRQALC